MSQINAPDAGFRGRILHRAHARFAMPVPSAGGAAALVLPPGSIRLLPGQWGTCFATTRRVAVPNAA